MTSTALVTSRMMVPSSSSSSRHLLTASVSRSSLSTAAFVDYHGSESSWKRPIYVAATRQHVGKTSTSVALLSGLQKRFDRVGFMKPVGQQCLQVWDEQDGVQINVDKDVALLKQHYSLDHLRYKHMSPVLIPRGYTKDYWDGKITNDSQRILIQNAYSEIDACSDVVLCEGTGHCAVGSIVGASNAKVASWIGADMVLVANGGLGKAYDELELNRILCLHHGVNVAGVVINKVQPDKYEQTQHYLSRALEQEGIPLLGCIPDRPFLGCPALADLERLFGTELLCGEAHRYRHYTLGELNLVATSLAVFLHNLRIKPTRTLYVCHASRHDILLGFIGEYQRRVHTGEEPLESALVVCGNPDKYKVQPELLDMMVGLNDEAPILRSPYSTRETMELIHSHTPKLNANDEGRVNAAVEHYEPYIDFDLLLERTGNAQEKAKVFV